MAATTVTVRKISPNSAFRVSLAMSLMGLLAWIVCVVLLYLALQLVGIWDTLNSVVTGVGGEGIIGFGMVLSGSALVGAACALTTTLLAPIVAIIYNATVDLFGGLVVELSDPDR